MSHASDLSTSCILAGYAFVAGASGDVQACVALANIASRSLHHVAKKIRYLVVRSCRLMALTASDFVLVDCEDVLMITRHFGCPMGRLIWKYGKAVLLLVVMIIGAAGLGGIAGLIMSTARAK
eukprot:6969455-Karenia_brevis.AAC.1